MFSFFFVFVSFPFFFDRVFHFYKFFVSVLRRIEMTGNNPLEKDDNKMRFFDDDGYRQRAACICVRNQYEDEVRSLPVSFFSIFCFRIGFIDHISS